ncbi:Retrovirus-related Pol polyprotein from transposon opus [Vitis vinifera]|uniref:Retrovirus-related Pol polyprotein from transposon opus n=1 Tax=Vitis vinifera TaxID=29760 RepID=A0A438HJL0_VITVI|nr:Retrovirus-related Pol polyprotein from transposon opus [Vitis vinifera]
MGEPSSLGNPLGTRESACVEVMTTLHGSTPSPWRHVEGCIPPEGTIASARDPLTRPFYLIEPFQPCRSIYVPNLDLPSWTRVRVYCGHGHDSGGYSWPRPEDSQIDVIRLPVVALILNSEDVHTRMDRLEQRMRQMRISKGVISWDDFDGAPMASLPAQFRMPEIERYAGIGCPKIHLRLYSTMMRAHGLDEAQLIMLFPMSLSGVMQHWFASLDTSCHRTWDDLSQEFLRQIAFNIVIDVSRRELEALRQGLKETMTSFISRWREKIAQIVDRPSKMDQISLRETSYFIPSALSPTNYYSLSIEANTTILPTWYAFESSFPEAHGGCLISNWVPFELIPTASLTMARQGPSVLFILCLEDDGSEGSDIQIVTHSGRVAQPSPLVARPLDGATSYEEIHIETTTTPKGLIHMMMIDKATCIVFSDDGFPPKGSNHTRPLYITVGCSRHRVPSVLLDNGSTLNVCLLATTIALGYAPSDFGPSTQTIRAYDSTKRDVMGRRWIHRAGVILSSLHQKVKFIHDRQTLEVEDFFRDFIAMSFDQHSSIVVLDMVRGMSFLPGMGERVKARLTCTPFNYPVRPYRMSLADDFIRGLEVHSHMGDFSTVIDIDGVDELQHQFHHLQLGDETSGILVSVMIAHSSPDRANFLSLCFLEKTTNCGVVVEPTKIAEMVQPEPISTFDLFRVSAIELDLDRDSFDHDSDPIDERVSPATRDVETVDFGIEDQPRELKIGSLLSTNERIDLFIYSEEIQKQLGVGFISMVEYLEWLANIVPVPKNDGKVRVCVNFKDLNKASPKDDFPLTHIDLLVDSIADHSMLSFMDGFLGSHLSKGRYYFVHDMMHRDVEVYKDDMIVKSQGKANHLAALERFFERIQKFILRLNPKKCTFGVTYGKLLGHMVNERGIEVDLDKIKAILDMPMPRIEKEIRGFLGRL